MADNGRNLLWEEGLQGKSKVRHWAGRETQLHALSLLHMHTPLVPTSQPDLAVFFFCFFLCTCHLMLQQQQLRWLCLCCLLITPTLSSSWRSIPLPTSLCIFEHSFSFNTADLYSSLCPSLFCFVLFSFFPCLCFSFLFFGKAMLWTALQVQFFTIVFVLMWLVVNVRKLFPETGDSSHMSWL